MWQKGLWQSPRYRLMNGMLLRVEYAMLEEPAHVKEFRARLSENLLMENFTWIPQDGERSQEVFVKRVWDSDSSAFGLETIVWDRMEDQWTKTFMAASTIRLYLGVLGDLLTKNTKWSSTVRSETFEISERLAVGEDGEVEEHKNERGQWKRRESSFERWNKQASGAKRAIKGPELPRGGGQ